VDVSKKAQKGKKKKEKKNTGHQVHIQKTAFRLPHWEENQSIVRTTQAGSRRKKAKGKQPEKNEKEVQ